MPIYQVDFNLSFVIKAPNKQEADYIASEEIEKRIDDEGELSVYEIKGNEETNGNKTH